MPYLLLLFSLYALPDAYAEEYSLNIIAHVSVPTVKPLSIQQLRRIYLLQQLSWSDDLAVIVINRKSDSVQREYFEKKINLSPTKYAMYLKKQHYKGIPTPIIQNSRQAVLAFVEKVPGSIAYIEGLLPDGYEHIKVIGYLK